MNYIITALILIGCELNFFFNLKPLFGIKKHVYKKPFDCFFCLSIWGNTIGTLSIVIIHSIKLKSLSLDLNLFIGWAFCILLSKIIDLLWNKN